MKLSSQPGYDHIRVTIGNNLGAHLASSQLDNDGQGSMWPGREDARSVSEMRDGKVPDQIKAATITTLGSVQYRSYKSKKNEA